MEAVIAGALCKVYDDLSDNQLVSGWIMEALKGLQWIFLTILSVNDFNFAFLFYSLNGLNAWNNPSEWSPAYEFSLLVVCPIFILLSWGKRTSFNLFDYVYFSAFLFCMAFEPLLIPEEFSILKWFLRSGAAVNSIVGLWFGPYFGVSKTMLKFTGYCAGYCVLSSLYQVAMLTSSGTFSLPNSDLS